METEVALCMALTRPQRYETALAKCTELGASEFRPIITERVLRADATVNANRMERWRRIVSEAAELSGRVRVPMIAEPTMMNSVLDEAQNTETVTLLLWEGAREPMFADLLSTLRTAQEPPCRVVIILGPVGGFSEVETRRIVGRGASITSLGTRILRTETAAIAAMSVAAQILP